MQISMIDFMVVELAERLVLLELRLRMGECIAYPKLFSELSENSENFPPVRIIMHGNIH